MEEEKKVSEETKSIMQKANPYSKDHGDEDPEMEDEEETGNLGQEEDYIRKSSGAAHFRHLYHELEQLILGYKWKRTRLPPPCRGSHGKQN